MARSTASSTRTKAFDRRVRLSAKAKRVLVTRNMTDIMRAKGIKRAARHVGQSIYDYDVAPHLRPVAILAAWIAQNGGHKTVTKADMQVAQHHINGIKPIPQHMLVPKLPAALRSETSDSLPVPQKAK